MLVNYFQPEILSGLKLDEMLSQGWFRSGSGLYKSEIICLADEVSDILHIRLNLEAHNFTKTQRKLLRKNDNIFKVVVKPLRSVSAAKNRLYQNSKGRFRGFLMHNLNAYLNLRGSKKIFNTYEVCIYDGIKLIAVSFFDLGNKSVASILALMDWNYAANSLNKYTMLKEIEFGKAHGFEKYYPGYVLTHSDAFDYKLKIGNFDYLNEHNTWATFIEKHVFPNSIKENLYAKTALIEKALMLKNKKSDLFIYPLFTFGNPIFEQLTNTKYLNAPIFVFENYEPKNEIFITYHFDIESKIFVKSKVVLDKYYIIKENMFAKENVNNNLVFRSLLQVIEIVDENKNLANII